MARLSVAIVSERLNPDLRYSISDSKLGSAEVDILFLEEQSRS